jgi:hypothetical protein
MMAGGKYIFHMGTQDPTVAQRRVVRAIADDSFTRTVPDDFGCLPCPQTWRPDAKTAIALRAKYVSPHVDDWVGIGSPPSRYVALFWVVEMPRFERLTLQVGTEVCQMSLGDFVVFNDTVMHSVFADKFWRGCAYQARLTRSARGS